MPTATSTVIAAWTDRAVDAQRMNLAAERPEVQAASARLADAYHQLGVGGAEASRTASTELGGFVKIEATARGIRARACASSAWSPGASACW